MIVVCGEALIDLVPVPDSGASGGAYAARPGGSPANVAVGLGRLGVEVQLLARLADDPFGRLLEAHLSGSHVDLSAVARTSAPSTLAVVTLDDAGKAEYAFYVEGAADGGWRVDELPAELPAGATVHVSGSLALGVPSMGDAVEALLTRERGSRVLALDPNVRPLLAQDEGLLRRRLEAWLGLVDLVKVSEDDLTWIAPGEAPEAVAERWRGLGVTVVVVTRGEQGVLALAPGARVELPAARIEVVDTVGAGDSFMAGLLEALDGAGLLTPDGLVDLTEDALRTALDRAQQVASITCQRAGADPPWAHELRAGATP